MKKIAVALAVIAAATTLGMGHAVADPVEEVVAAVEDVIGPDELERSKWEGKV